MVSDVISKLLITLLNEDIFKIEKWQFKKKMSCLDGQVTHFTEMNFLHIRILPIYFVVVRSTAVGFVALLWWNLGFKSPSRAVHSHELTLGPTAYSNLSQSCR